MPTHNVRFSGVFSHFTGLYNPFAGFVDEMVGKVFRHQYKVEKGCLHRFRFVNGVPINKSYKATH